MIKLPMVKDKRVFNNFIDWLGVCSLYDENVSSQQFAKMDKEEQLQIYVLHKLLKNKVLEFIKGDSNEGV